MEEKTKRLIDGTDLLTVLSASGLRTDRVGKMYYSPWNQDEVTPSMHISVTSSGRQLWSCFGPVPDRVTRILNTLSGKEKKTTGGGVLDLICAIHGFDTYGKAIRWLEEHGSSCVETVSARREADRTTGESAFVIDKAESGISSRYLLSYLEQRCVDVRAANAYCQQLTYRLKKNPRTSYVGIGFANNGGSYAIRSRQYKWSTGADISTIDRFGSMTLKPSCNEVLVFEGFINFLSWLTIEKKTVPGCDICVLNSVNNVERAVPYLLQHDTIRCMLDNDAAGQKCLSTIETRMRVKEDVSVKDESVLYDGYDDINDWLQAKNQDL